MNTDENGQRHAAVRPDVFDGNRRPRTWLWRGERLQREQALWIVELGSNRYLRCDERGQTWTYECASTPTLDGAWMHLWEEI